MPNKQDTFGQALRRLDESERTGTRGFDLTFESAVITGHIDFLQIRNGHVHILDCKPDARKEKHARVQLTVYALALARRAGLPLKSFKCGWFDEKDYFEFFPLTGVYRSRSAPPQQSMMTSLRFHGPRSTVEDEDERATPYS